MKVMVLGGAGMLGSALVNNLRKNSRLSVVSVGRENCDLNLDCLDFHALKATIESGTPDVIVNCIAIVNLKLCEENKQLAEKTHIELPRFLSKFKNIYHIYISTDSVYSGVKSCWSEKDDTKPLNYYAQTKLIGELPTIESGGLVVRTNIYGKTGYCLGNSLFEWAYKSIQEGVIIKGYDNVYFNPLSVNQLSLLIANILNLPNLPIGEVLNAGSDGALSKYDFINALLSLYNPNVVTVEKSKLVDKGIIRPKNTTLCTQKMYALTGYKFNVNEGLRNLLEELSV